MLMWHITKWESSTRAGWAGIPVIHQSTLTFLWVFPAELKPFLPSSAGPQVRITVYSAPSAGCSQNMSFICEMCNRPSPGDMVAIKWVKWFIFMAHANKWAQRLRVILTTESAKWWSCQVPRATTEKADLWNSYYNLDSSKIWNQNTVKTVGKN